MSSNQYYDQYIEDKKAVQEVLLKYIENDDNTEENYQNLNSFLKDKKFHENRPELKTLFMTITRIANYHERSSNFFAKIEKIILIFKEVILKEFNNMDIFNIFRSNKHILLFLLEEEILKLDCDINNLLLSDDDLFYYFYPELSSFNGTKHKDINSEKDKKMLDYIANSFDEFKNKRKIGENDTHICQLIQKDDIDNFISYFNQNDISSMSNIEKSIFETNTVILNGNITKNRMNENINESPNLLEYSAFFGSIIIFKFLYKNNAKLTPSLLKYAVHGSHPEIIHILEENNLFNLAQAFDLSMKYFNNDLFIYIQNNNDLKKNSEFTNLQNNNSFSYFNFLYFPPSLDITDSFFNQLCRYGYYALVKDTLKNKHVKIDNSLLFDCIRENHVEIFELLFENGNFSANEQYAYLNFRKISFFQYAVFIEKEQIVSYLLSQKGIDVNQFLDIKKSKKETISKAPLHFAIEKANVGIVSLI